MGACCTKEQIKESKKEIKNETEPKKLTVQEQLHKHWNNNKHVMNMYPSFQSR
jgi:hypothetical protein